MDVSEALKNTSKGQLPYPKPWEECTATERKKFLTAITSPPQLPPEVTTHRTRPPITATPTTQPDDVSVCSRSPSPSGSPSSPPATPSTPPATPQYVANTTYVVSPINTVRDDFQCYLEYNEDSVLSEVEANMTRWKSHFSSIREDTSVHSTTVCQTSFREDELQRQAQEEEEEATELKTMIEDLIKSNEQSYQDHYQSLKEQIQQNEQQKIKQMNELREARNRRRMEMIAHFEHYEKQSAVLVEMINKLLTSCKYPQFLAREDLTKLINSINTTLGKLLSHTATEKQADNPKEEALQVVVSLFDRCRQLLAMVSNEIQNADKRGEEYIKKQMELERIKKEEEDKAKKQQQPVTVTIKSSTTEQKDAKKDGGGGKTADNTNSSLGVSAPPSALQSYAKSQEKIEYCMKNTETLTKSNDPKLKKYRFELQKAVNTPVCAISSQSGVHLAEQIKRLKDLLSGRSVSVMGGAVSANDHPEAKLYCMNFLAKKLVKQGEEQVSSRPISAFPIAGVIVHLSCQFPEFLQLFVAHCQASCPSLVPLYFEKSKTTNESEWRQYVA